LTQIHPMLVEHYGEKILSHSDASSWVRRFASSEKALKIRDPAKNAQISKLISKLRENSNHPPMLQFETLLRQRYSISSLKFFIWNFVTGDESPTNSVTTRDKQEYNLLFRCRPSLRMPSGANGQSSPLAMSPGYSAEFFERMLAESGQ
jgi:hypothetical protein